MLFFYGCLLICNRTITFLFDQVPKGITGDCGHMDKIRRARNTNALYVTGLAQHFTQEAFCLPQPLESVLVSLPQMFRVHLNRNEICSSGEGEDTAIYYLVTKMANVL